MKVLVTGTDGYIGTVLADTLMSRGHDVTGIDVGFYRDGWLYGGVTRLPACLTLDTRDITVEHLKGYDAVIHLAELSNDPLGQLNPDLTYKINHQGGVELARKCKEAGVTRFIYSSSCSVYGVGTGDLKDEHSKTNPQTAYASCKELVERDVAKLADDDFSPVFLRNATAYGASPRMRFDLVVNNLCGVAWTTEQIKMTSDGTPWRPLVHILDISEAMACALEAPREVIHNETFNVGDSSENYQVRDIAEIIAEVFPGCEVVFGSLDGDNRSYKVSFDKINSLLPGFRCSHTVRSGVEELLEVFQRIQMPLESFKFRAFTRLNQLQYLIATKQVDDEFFFRLPKLQAAQVA